MCKTDHSHRCRNKNIKKATDYLCKLNKTFGYKTKSHINVIHLTSNLKFPWTFKLDVLGNLGVWVSEHTFPTNSQVSKSAAQRLPCLAHHLSEFNSHLENWAGLPRWISGKKNLPANAGNMGSIPGSGRSPGEGNGNPLQYSCLENPRDRGAWRTTVHGVAKSWTWLSDWARALLLLLLSHFSRVRLCATP